MFASKDTLLTRPSGYNIARSVRLRSSASAYFNRTPASATNRTTWTWSGWVKRGTLGVAQMIFQANAASGTTDNDRFLFYFNASNQIEVDGALQVFRVTNAVFRDPSAWYHIVLTVDTGNATTNNRMLLYVNGASQSFSTNYALSPSQLLAVNGVYPHYFSYLSGSNFFLDGYLTEINFIDGQALTPSSFGETDSITGVWKAKKYGGTYGTNGFYLNFSDNSNNTAATIGKDYSGNGNNWTPNNINVTAYSGTPPNNVSYDSMVDSPTVGSLSSNYAVMNPLAIDASSPPTITNGNLAISSTGALATIPMPTGKWYWEATCTSTDADQAVGAFSTSESGKTSISGASNPTYGFIYQANGNARQNGTVVQTWSTFTNNDILSFTYDASIYQLKAYKNNSLVGTITLTTPLSGDSYVPMACCLGGSFAFNFGQRPFSYTPPSGFVALNTYNLPASTIKNGAAYMAATLYTGTGASLTVANTVGSASFQPDFVWVKGRSGATDHALYDSVRGVQKQIESNQTGAETTETTGLTAFGSTGFTVGALAQMNTSSATYVGWQWKAGTTSSSNTDGTITSTVSAGATQGFSVVTYTGNGTLNATIGHGLGVAPSMVIIKNRVGANNWDIYHISNGAQKYMDFTTAGVGSLSTIFPTTPTSSVVYLGTTGGQNTNATNYVAYCFSAVAGYSAIGSYTGNSSTDGTFVYTGFRPRFVLIKGIGSGGSGWQMNDSSRNTYNPEDAVLRADLSNAETTAYGNVMDFLSNGFKLRVTDTNYNSSSTTYGPYIYMAFAENPFKHSLAR